MVEGVFIQAGGIWSQQWQSRRRETRHLHGHQKPQVAGLCEQLNCHEVGRWPHWGQPRSAGWPEQQGTSLVICEISSFTTQCLILKKLTKGYCLFQWLNFEQVDFDKNQTCFCSLPCLPIHTNNKQKHILTAIWPMKGLIWTVLQEERPLSIPNHFYLPNHCRRDTTFTVSASQFSFMFSSSGYHVISLGR